MSNSLTTQQQMNAMVATAAQGMLSVLAFSGMSQFVATGMAGIASMEGGMSAKAELADLSMRIRKLGFVLERYRTSIVSLRKRRIFLMKHYGLIITPPLVEMSKYPQLRAVETNIKNVEKDLNRLEIKDMMMRKRKNELQMKLGIKAEEPEPRIQRPVMKKFTPSSTSY